MSILSLRVIRALSRSVLLVGVSLPPMAVEAQGASGVAIGSFCIDGVSVKRGRSETPTTDGVWRAVTYTYTRTKTSGDGRLIVFDRPIAESEALRTCAEASADALAAGAKLLLSGRLNSLTIKGQIFTANNGNNRLQIDPGGLKAELGSVDSGAVEIGGGTMSLHGALLYVKNPSRLLVTANAMEGILEIEAWDRRIDDARIALPGDFVVPVLLSPVSPSTENVFIRFDTAAGAASLWKARLKGSAPQPTSGSHVDLAAIRFDSPTATVQQVLVTARDGQLDIELDNARGSATAARLVPKATCTASQPDFSWTVARASATQSPDAFTLADLEMRGLEATTDDLRLGVDEGLANVVLMGPGRARLDKLTTSTVTGHFNWTRPAFPPGTHVFPTSSLNSVAMDVDGDLSEPSFSAVDVRSERIRVAGMALEQPLGLMLDIPDIQSEIRIPIKLDAKKISGSFTLEDPDQKAVIAGGLAEARLASTLVIPVTDLAATRLEVDAGGFAVALEATVASKPFVAGVAPVFASAGVRVHNETAVVASMKGSSGLLDIDSSLLTLNGPIMHIGEGAKQAKSTLELKAEGESSLRYDLASGLGMVAKGYFEVRDIHFQLLDPAGTLDLGGTSFSAPTLDLALLVLHIDIDATPPLGSAAGTGLKVAASTVVRARDPNRPNDVVYSGKQSRPLGVSELVATATITDAVKLGSLEVTKLDLAMHDVEVEFGSGFAVHGASFGIGADKVKTFLRDDKPHQRLDNAHFEASGTLNPGSAFHVNNDPGFSVQLDASGDSDHLVGSGTVELGAFTGSKIATTPFKFECADGRDHLDVPIEYNFAFGGASLELLAVDGRFSANASAGPLALLVHSLDGTECRSPSHKWLIAKECESWTTWPCSKCCPLEFWECKMCTPEVSFNWHVKLGIRGLAATALVTSPYFSLQEGRLHVCNRGAIQVHPIVVGGGYSPQIETPYPAAHDLVNNLLQVTFESTQTILYTSLADGLGYVVTNVATPVGNLSCLF